MNDQSQTAHQLTVISDGLLGLFADYCKRTSSPELENMLAAFRTQRLDLVMTVHASMYGTDFVCCALPLGGTPSDLVQLFTVHTIPTTQLGKAH